MFRSALGGFNKADVLNYIDGLTGSWNEERVQLEEQARTDRDRAAQAEKAAAKAQEEQQASEADLKAALEALESIRPLAEQVEELKTQLAQARNDLSEALAEKSRLATSLAQSEEKSQSARVEMMAAEERLQAREAELTNRNQRIATLETLVTRYEAVLGHSGNMQEHIDGILRPFSDTAARRAESTLDDTYAVIAALLAQLGELQGSIEQQKRTLQQEKAETDATLNRVLGSWFTKAKELAETAAARTTHFFR